MLTKVPSHIKVQTEMHTQIFMSLKPKRNP
jgi:hypothetical protein